MVDLRSESDDRDTAEILESVLATYAELHRRMGCSEPDAGFDEAYAQGMRGLTARAQAEPFGLDPQRRQIIAALIQEAEAAAEEDIPAWLAGYPRRILGALDRRSDPLGEVRRGRRWLDQRQAQPPRPAAPRPAAPRARRTNGAELRASTSGTR